MQFILCFVFIVAGINSNLQTILENNGKMPVYVNGNIYQNYTEDNYHIYYNNSMIVNRSDYSDNFNLGNLGVYSIGDILFYLGCFWLLISLFINWFKLKNDK